MHQHADTDGDMWTGGAADQTTEPSINSCPSTRAGKAASVSRPGWYISTAIRSILERSCIDIHGPQRMKPTNLTFPLEPPLRWHMWFWLTCSTTTEWTAMKFGAAIHVAPDFSSSATVRSKMSADQIPAKLTSLSLAAVVGSIPGSFSGR